jgi:type II secretory pathway pseudopilin PulG
MTMLELVVVIAVFGIFMSLAIPTVTKSLASMARVKSSTATYPEARRALGSVCDALRQAYTAADAGVYFDGKSSSYEAGGVMFPADEINFPILDSRYARLGSVQNMSFKLELTPTLNDTLHGLIQTRAPAGAPPGAGIRESLVKEAIGLDLKYLDASQDPPVWVQEWPPEEETIKMTAGAQDAAQAPSSPNLLPAAVEVTIYVLGKVSLQPIPFRMTVNIPAARQG